MGTLGERRKRTIESLIKQAKGSREAVCASVTAQEWPVAKSGRMSEREREMRATRQAAKGKKKIQDEIKKRSQHTRTPRHRLRSRRVHRCKRGECS